MPFYRKRLTYDEIAPFVQKFQTFLRANSSVVQEAGDGKQEVFLVDTSISREFERQYIDMYSPLSYAKMIHVAPYDYHHILVYFDPKAEGPMPTVSPTHVRLPKLSYLITLVPADFFTLLQLIATAKNTPAKDSLSLNPAAVGITSIASSALHPFFTLLRTNYRLNAETADRKWTSRDAIKQIAHLDPTRENHLVAMQYLTALQNPDLIYFPLEARLDLDLDWEQADNNYCIPENRTAEPHLPQPWKQFPPNIASNMNRNYDTIGDSE